MRHSGSRLAQSLALVVACAAVAFLSSAFLIGSTPDEEEFRFAVLSAFLTMRGIWHGESAFWTPLVGLGIPQPFVPNLTLHPLAPLLGVMSPVAWVRLLLLAHTAIGAAGMWALGRALALAPIVRAACVVTFLLAAPVHNYVLADFWPTHHVVWTLMPWVTLMVWRVLHPTATPPGRAVAPLGVTAGVMTVTANPAYLVIYLPMLITIAAAHWRAAFARARALVAVAAMTIAIAAPTLVQLSIERRYFAPDLVLSNVTEPLPRSALADALVRPFGADGGTRTLFFGGPFAALCLVGCVWFARTRADLVLGLAVSAVLAFTASVPVSFVSQRYQFRDPLTLCAIVLAGLAVDRLLRDRRTRTMAVALLVAQVVIVVMTTWPLIQRTLEPEWRRAPMFRGATGATTLVDTLVEHMIPPGRLLYSPRVDHDVTERAFVSDGLGVNALAYRGIQVVNGLFKGVSADAIWPSDRLFYGRVRAPEALVASPRALDVLAIRYVLAHRDEALAPQLRERATLKTTRGVELVLYENPGAWPGAFLVDATFGDDALPKLAGCGNGRLFCRDLATIAAHRDPRGVSMTRESGGIRAQWRPVSDQRILVVSEMFRPEWEARTGDRGLDTRAMYGGLLGVPLPAGVGEVELRYRPTAQRMATALSIGVLIVGLVIIVWPRSVRP